MVKSIRTAGYGPVCPVVWEGGGREAVPYPDSSAFSILSDTKHDGQFTLNKMGLAFPIAAGQSGMVVKGKIIIENQFV